MPQRVPISGRHVSPLIVLVAALALTACGPNTAVSPGASAPESALPSASPAASKGPATALFTIAGEGGLAGPLTDLGVSCLLPSLDGTEITMFGSAPIATEFIRITVIDGATVDLRLNMGSGADYRERDFRGTGVTGFDPALGFRVDTPMTDVTPANGNPGNLEVITSLRGTVDCGNQRAGTSAVRVSGMSDQGQVDTVPNPVRVGCSKSATGNGIQVIGIGQAPGTPVLIFITVGAGRLSVAWIPKTGPTRFYTVETTDPATFTADGAEIHGDVISNAVAGPTAPVLHVEGRATCGTTTPG